VSPILASGYQPRRSTHQSSPDGHLGCRFSRTTRPRRVRLFSCQDRHVVLSASRRVGPEFASISRFHGLGRYGRRESGRRTGADWAATGVNRGDSRHGTRVEARAVNQLCRRGSCHYGPHPAHDVAGGYRPYGRPRKHDLNQLCGYLSYYLRACGNFFFAFYITNPLDWGGPARDSSPAELRLKLSLLHEQRRLRAAELALDARYSRSAYKETIRSDVAEFRRRSGYYRRINNGFQSIVILGSLATTTVSGIALDGSPYQWIAVGTSFSVGAAAGFTGYFKYRERGFYLQQTADSIEQEWMAADLEIFRYRKMPSDEHLAALVEEVERLKSEQRKREQSLDQPSEGRQEPT